MKKVKIILPFVLTVAILVSCTERIDLPLDESSVKLVVEGTVTTDTTIHTVWLTETTGYYYNQEPPVVSGANVSITDGETVFYLKETYPGLYETSPEFHGIEGRSYTLNIRLSSPIGGFTEYTATSVMDRMTVLDSVSLNFYPDFAEQGLWEVNCWLKDSVSTDFYRFDLLRNNQLITHKLSKWIVTDDTFFNGDYVNGAAITYLDQSSDNEKLVKGDTLTVELKRISRNYYSFIQEAQAELRGSNPLFSGPGANVKGNISNGAIGFFAAFPVTRVEIIVP